MTAQNLPTQSTPFIGRAKDLVEIDLLLNDPTCRLLSLVGPGGSGKTRLAIQVALKILENFADGVYFVALAPLGSSEDIAPAIGNTLGLRLSGDEPAIQQLLTFLHDKQLLLVLDNFEHLLDGATLVSNILDGTQWVKLLVTSREVLSLQGEWVWQIKGLQFPEGQDSRAIHEYSALELFAERARRVRSDFALVSGTVI